MGQSIVAQCQVLTETASFILFRMPLPCRHCNVYEALERRVLSIHVLANLKLLQIFQIFLVDLALVLEFTFFKLVCFDLVLLALLEADSQCLLCQEVLSKGYNRKQLHCVLSRVVRDLLR